MTTQVEGWTFAEDGAPAARSDTVSISWGRGRRICIESDPNAVGETWIPADVIEEIARRAQAWHWQPPKKAAPETPQLERCPACPGRHPRGTNQCPVTKKWLDHALGELLDMLPRPGGRS